jgi:phosphoribosylformimino-5-aminoimidazole carboxamide ribotide isomerase
MSAIEIIPAIDLIDGKCVRLEQGNYSVTKVYSRDPVDMAKSFEDVGLRRLHLVDLDGARARRLVNYRVLEAIATKTSLVIDFSGGLASDHDVRVALDSGASLLCVGSVAVKDPNLFLEWLKQVGADRLILAADVREGKVAVSGWEEQTPLTIRELIDRYLPHGLQHCMTTDVNLDGMLQGPSEALYAELVEEYQSINWIASGGVSTIDDVYRLSELGIKSVVVGKAIYEKRITLEQLREFVCP